MKRLLLIGTVALLQGCASFSFQNIKDQIPSFWDPNQSKSVIDIRQSADCIETSVETLKIPFYKLKSEFKKLPQDKTYLFYCDKGILSQLHAQFLRDSENYTNIKVYRPL